MENPFVAVFKLGSHYVAQVGSKSRLVLNLQWSSCVSFPSVVVTGVHHHGWLGNLDIKNVMKLIFPGSLIDMHPNFQPRVFRTQGTSVVSTIS